MAKKTRSARKTRTHSKAKKARKPRGRGKVIRRKTGPELTVPTRRMNHEHRKARAAQLKAFLTKHPGYAPTSWLRMILGVSRSWLSIAVSSGRLKSAEFKVSDTEHVRMVPVDALVELRRYGGR